ncbi:unnamed protein product, partial [marine sediment metagenome]
MDKLDKDTLYSIAIELDLPSLLKFCASNSRINELICKRDPIWLNKLNKDFPNYKDFKLKQSKKDIYILLYNLTKLKKKLNLKQNILELYNLQELNLSNNKL